jgi:hypothetical protein
MAFAGVTKLAPAVPALQRALPGITTMCTAGAAPASIRLARDRSALHT